MRVKVKFFASYRELIGEDEEEFQLEKGAMLKNLRTLVVSTHPVFKDVEGSMLASLNETLVEDEEILLKEGDEVAFFPSSSGG